MEEAKLRSQRRREFILEGSLFKVIFTIALPQVTTMLIDSFYNIADTLNWDKLYPLFNELYNHIADKLKELYPDLSEKELQFCCFIRAGFRQEEIAAILSYEYNSMRTIKMRLRTKMGFEHYDDFDQFLFNL